MRFIIIIMLILLGIACSAKDAIPPDQLPIVSDNFLLPHNDYPSTIIDTGVTIPTDGLEIIPTLHEKGIMNLDIGKQQLLIRTENDFYFWYKFTTTKFHLNPKEIIDNYDVILLMTPKTNWTYELNLQKILVNQQDFMSLYYSYSHNHYANDYGSVIYQFFLINKSTRVYNFIEVE